jgi:hypothetical protein
MTSYIRMTTVQEKAMCVLWFFETKSVIKTQRRYRTQCIVTDLINALPGNSYVNTVKQAAIDEAVFSMLSAASNSRNGVLCNQLLGYATVLTIELFSVWSVPRLYNEINRGSDRIFSGAVTIQS